ncbi:class I SAM-dependent methyltransferase [[Mycobacterium] burgundiense]|uniref:Class I SAM-dependent methyltransferase n=1 Tax=[Mycobacterium] burgundiense TaxID=3064286 RepID=A0ABN9NB63_9MYCO|nr:class I SAM-dependent methyltransferase [Mycolicibacterium sp. MU0053]CAJ1501780.1 class I SAM-dependent methyltransferase [Mycolicibacterium sp. MU0053]
MESTDTQQMWEDRYAESERIWSGRPNARLVEVVSDLPTGTALELGCGEGGDTVWLAQRGWQVVAVDIANTALQRAAEALTAAGDDLATRVRFERHDLTVSFPQGSYDLVTAHFLHSPHGWDRNPLMRRAAAAVAPGGRLLIVDHAEAPPWSERIHDHEFPSAEAVVAGMELDPAQWERERVERAEWEGTGPDGRPGSLVDNVIVLRRR